MNDSRRRLLLIADLRHASPRWPALGGALIAEGWDVTAVTAPLGPDAAESLGFPRLFATRARFVECGPATDALEPVRKLLWLFGLRRRQSLTEQIKARLPAQGTRSAFDRVFQTVLALIGWPDLQAPWRRPALRATRELLAREAFDVMVSSSPYPTSHAVAARIKREHPSLRWVADFRDLWSQNHNYSMPRWRQRVDTIVERNLLSGADAVCAPTEAWAALLARTHEKVGACVPNGFVDYEQDLDGTQVAADPADADRVVLLYTGLRYPEHQAIRPVLAAISNLKRDGVVSVSNFTFRWIGPFDAETAVVASELGISDLVDQRLSVPRRAARAAQLAADALLFLQWDDPETEWSSSLKLHEYVGSGRPILATGGWPTSAVSTLLAATGHASLAVAPDMVQPALRAIVSRGKVPPPRPGQAADAVSRQLSGISRGLGTLEGLLRGPTGSVGRG